MVALSYLVYAKEAPKDFSGLLGPLQLHVTHLLLSGGKTLIEETYDGDDPVGWYTECLKQQEIYIESSKIQSYKGQTIVWLQVDMEQTKISEFTNWTEISKNDRDTLAWRTVWYPCSSETNKECLGLAVVAKEIFLQEKTSLKHPLSLQQVLDAIINQS